MDKRGFIIFESLLDATATGTTHVWHAFPNLPFACEALSRHCIEIHASNLDAAIAIARFYHPLVKAIPGATPRLLRMNGSLRPKEMARAVTYNVPPVTPQPEPADLMPGDIDWLMEQGPNKAMEV